MRTIPEHFAQHMIDIFADDGAAWLQRLPRLLADCEQRWSLTIGPPFEPLSYNYVAGATRADGSQVVIKAGVPVPELHREIEALRFYDGHGLVQLLDADAEQGLLLLERLQPGTMLLQLEDDERAIAIAGEVMRKLWRPAPQVHSFPSVADWAAGLQELRTQFAGGTGPFPTELVEMAETLFGELLDSMEE